MAFARYLLIALIALALIPAITVPVASAEKIAAVTIDIDVKKISGGYIYMVYTMSFEISGYNDTVLVVPLPSLFSKPRLLEAKCLLGGENIVKNAKLDTSGIPRVVMVLSKAIGSSTATVEIKIEGKAKSTSKLYATKDYKLYKDYKPISKKILYLEIANYFYNVKWSTAKKDGETVPALRVIVRSPPEWDIFYARSSLSMKVRYMDIKKIYREGDRMIVEFWYLSTKTIYPTSFSPGKHFDIEVGFLPRSDYAVGGPVLVAGILLIILAGFFAWYYRDVWKYVPKAVG